MTVASWKYLFQWYNGIENCKRLISKYIIVYQDNDELQYHSLLKRSSFLGETAKLELKTNAYFCDSGLIVQGIE